MSRSLPPLPKANLEQLRNQAKDLRKAHGAGDRGACAVLRHLRQFAQASDDTILGAKLSLQDAQHALAREYGFAGWRELKRHVEGATPPSDWCETIYQASVSSRCWWFTPYDDGWGGAWTAGAIERDGELRQIVEMELALGEVPQWAEQVVAGPIRHVAPCGHYRFPLSYLDAVRAIGARSSPPLTHTCYTCEPQRKRQFLAYAQCIEAWLAGKSPAAAAQEMDESAGPDSDWPQVCRDIWGVLGEPTQLKRLMLERWVIQTRWLAKSMTWDGDQAEPWPGGPEIGERQPGNALVRDNGNPHYKGPGWDLAKSARARELEAQLAKMCPNWPFFQAVLVDFYWPCAPKAFRFLEKTLWCVGREKQVISLPSFPMEAAEAVPSFLGATDTPDRGEAAAWWPQFLVALDGWWQGRDAAGSVAHEVSGLLGRRDAVKRWLVRLLAHRLRKLEGTGESLYKLIHWAAQ